MDGLCAPAVVGMGVRGAGVFLAWLWQHLAAVHSRVVSAVPAAVCAHVAGATRHAVPPCLGDGRAQCRVAAGISLGHQLFHLRVPEPAPLYGACVVAAFRDAGADERVVPGLGALAGHALAVAGVVARFGAGHGSRGCGVQHQRTQGCISAPVAGRSPRLAATAERERIGRDLHDLLGHTLSLVALKSDLAARLVERDPQAARNEIDAVAQISRDALAQVRRAVTGIRAAGLVAELASARVLLDLDGITLEQQLETLPLPPEHETALALVVRKAATNVQRHAQATRVRVNLRAHGEQAVLEITDDGRGGVIVPGNGLDGMRARLHGLGGALEVEALPRGMRLRASVPLPGSAPATSPLPMPAVPQSR